MLQVEGLDVFHGDAQALDGVSLEVVSKTLGHAGLAITADVYAKVGEKLQRSAADPMQQVLGR